MTTVAKDLLKRILMPDPPAYEPLVSPGLHHYMRETKGNSARFHLRSDPDGHGILLANATVAAYLSPTGVVIAKGILEQQSQAEIAHMLERHFSGVTQQQVSEDVARVTQLVEDLASPIDNYPIINLEDAAVSPFEARLIAPLQADVPLTKPEALVPILDALWAAAIPHATILATGSVNSEDAIRAVERAEDLGMIAGLRIRASELAKADLIGGVAMAGLDHASIFYASADSDIHDAYFGLGDHQAAKRVFTSLRQNEIAAIALVPLIQETLAGLEATLLELLEQGVRNVFFYAIATADEETRTQEDGALAAAALPQAASLVEELSAYHDVRFIWQAPVKRDGQRSLREQVRRGARCSDEISILVEADGRVIPPRGPYRPAGNLLRDPWPTIWNQAVFRRYRERVETPTRCAECPGLAICAADCPRESVGWSLPPAQGVNHEAS